MRFRSLSLRAKVRVLVASLITLWLFAAWVTISDVANLIVVDTLNSKVRQPSEPVLVALQAERRLSTVYLGRPDRARHAALEDQRAKTRTLVTAFKAAATGWQVRLAGSSLLKQRVADAGTKLDALEATRAAVDDDTIDRASAAGAYSDAIDAVFQAYHAMSSLYDLEIASRSVALIGLHRSWELMSREDALLAGAIAAGRLTPTEHVEFVQLVAAQRWAAGESLFRLPADDRDRYDEAVAGAALSQLRALEAQVSHARPGTPPITAAEWQSVTAPAMAELNGVVLAGEDAVVKRAEPVATWAFMRLLVATGLGLAVVVVSLLSARTLVQQLEQLRRAARGLAEVRLPDVVTRISRGERVDAAAEAPPLALTEHEIGQVGAAFNTVQETALRTAAEQAELRRSVRDLFLSIARRTQALVHRQLTLLIEMQQRQADPDELEDLFRVDHLATRMRRNAENLIVLSGASAGRVWRRNVPMFDVARSAMGEVENYERVTVLPMGSAGLAGPAVGDMVHLLAELIENGLTFSPPHTVVAVRGQAVANGFAIEIEDRGLGMSGEDLAAANERINSQHELHLASADKLGLYVVSQLAARQGVRVHLKSNPYGGITAIVLIPTNLIADQGGGSGAIGSEPAAGPYRPHVRQVPERPSPVQLSEVMHRQYPLPATHMSEPPTGLPVRVRQANLHPELGEDSTAAETMPTEPRSPEEVRRRIGGYRLGTLRGRAAADNVAAEEAATGE